MQGPAIKDVARKPGFCGDELVIEAQLVNQVENLRRVLKAIGPSLAQEVTFDTASHDPADAIGRFDNGHRTAGLLQTVSAGEPRNTGSDDNDFSRFGFHTDSVQERDR